MYLGIICVKDDISDHYQTYKNWNLMEKRTIGNYKFNVKNGVSGHAYFLFPFLKSFWISVS